MKKLPEEINGYYFPEITEHILNRVERGKPIYLSSESGTGKTTLIKTLADYTNNKLLRINFSVGVSEQHIIGKFIVKNGATEFVHGILPLAMKEGYWLLLDEIDYALPEHLSVMQSVLDGDPLLLKENENEVIHPHKNFRLFATANTKGRGDDSQSYIGTNFLNIAFLDRWSIFEMTYTKKEIKILDKILNDKKLSKQLLDFFKVLRKAQDKGDLNNSVFSTRRLIEIAEALKNGESLMDSLNHELFLRYNASERETLKEYARDIWDFNFYLDKSWHLGDKHLEQT